MFVRGDPMSRTELDSYADLVPGDFRLMGWSARNLFEGQRLFAELTIDPKREFIN